MFFTSILLAASSSIITNDDKTDELLINTTVRAKPLKRINPKYPQSAASNKMEGWVVLSFVIDDDGSTSNVLVEQSSHRVFERAARKAVKNWRYSPAIQDGKPIQQCQTQVRIDFNLTKSSKGATKKFIAKYKSANKFLEQGNIPEFKRIISEMEKNGRKNRYEETYYTILKLHLETERNNLDTQLSAINYLLNQKDILSQEQYQFYAEKGFAMASNSKHYFKAKAIYKKVQDAYPEALFLTTHKPYHDQIISYLASDKPIIIDATIGSRDFWRYNLSRKGFIIDEVEGKLTNLEVRCDYKHSEYLVEPGNQWTIPESWGKCSLYVFGDQGTRFSFGEVNSKTAI